MNAAVYDPLRARVQALEQEIALMRQGVQQASRMRRLWEEALKDLQHTKQRLEFCHAQLGVCQRMSTVLDEPVDLPQLLENIMDVMERAPGVAQDRPMGIFLSEEERMRLVASRGERGAFIARDGSPGDDLCDLAAEAGKTLLCPVCGNDGTQGSELRGAGAHGLVIVPLTSRGRKVGAFWFYPSGNAEFDAVLGETLMAVGRQIGTAIEQARLREQAEPTRSATPD